MPKLSIITVNLNNATGLEKTMQSVFAQTFTDYEYIIIDGGSSDKSVEQIKKHQNKLVYWISEKDKGVYNAMNKGIVKATGDYLLFLNSGDYLVDAYVCERMLGEEDTDADIIYGKTEMVFPDGHKEVREIPASWTVEYLIKTAPNHNSSFISKRLFDEYGLYDETLKIVADWAFFFKVVITGNATTAYKDVNVVVYRMDGISNQPEGLELMKNERARVINEKLPPAVRDLLKNYQAVLLRNQQLEIILVRKNLLLKRLAQLTMNAFTRRVKIREKFLSKVDSRK